jgi:hypothetical protein
MNNERINNLLSRLTSKVTSLYELRLDEGDDRLDSLCTQKNWGLISHKNIKAIHLNGSGLHLNRHNW